jgi:hypothetical protein
MYNQSSTNQNERHEKKCDDKVKLPVERTIATLKNAYCTNLKGMVAELSESEVTYDGTLVTYNSRKCNFVKTEKNYRLVRNLELSVGVELAQASEEIKKNVAASVKQNDDVLVKVALKDLLTSVKDAKTKFGELRDAAYKLDACRKDSCNASQMIIIGCRQGDDCNDKGNNNEDNSKRPECCDNVCEILEDLISIPESLSRDIDIILSSTVEIAGIQSFSNIKTLVDFQTDFSLNAKAFNDLLLAQMKAGSTAVTKAQEDLITATTTLTQSAYVVYNKRMVVETADETKDYLCCHKCKCVGDDDCGCDDEDGDKSREGNHHNSDESRLARCKCEICEICTELKDVYCKEPQPESSC